MMACDVRLIPVRRAQLNYLDNGNFSTLFYNRGEKKKKKESKQGSMKNNNYRARRHRVKKKTGKKS